MGHGVSQSCQQMDKKWFNRNDLIRAQSTTVGHLGTQNGNGLVQHITLVIDYSYLSL